MKPVLTLLAPLLFGFATASAQNATVDVKKLRKEADAAVQAGNFDIAAATFRKITDANPKDGDAWHMLGYSLHAGGKLDEALPIHEKAAQFPGSAPAASYNVACVHALKGRPDEAFAWLDKAITAGFNDTKLLAEDADLASLRADERFAKVQKNLAEKLAKAPRVTAFAQTTERKSSRIAWFASKGSPGQIGLDYGPVAWNDEFEGLLADGKLKGKKWRLGSDFWTTLDNTMELRFGAVVVPAGYWYLTLEQRDGDTFVLALHDAAAAKKQKLDPVFAGALKGGIEVPLRHEKATDKTDHLEITIAPNQGSTSEGSLRIRFGGHELASPVSMSLE